MKTSVLPLIFAAFAFAIQGSVLSPGVEESISPNLRAAATCGDVSDLAPFVELYVAPVTTHVYTIYDKNITSSFVDSPSGTQFLGIAAFIFSIQDTSTVPFYCLHSAAQTAYFYTTNETEREAALATGFVDYMIAGYIYPSQICGSVPLYRLHLLAANLANSDYMYTTSETDRENAITLGFTYEGIAGYVYDLLSCGIPS